jgi:heat-inducible transcriptional repressor
VLMELTERMGEILRTIVREYIASGVPVASKTIAFSDVRVSPATVRNDVTALEDAGFVARPHTSAGSVPTDRAYRYFVESLRSDVQLPVGDRLLIAEVCHDTSEELDKRLRLVATLLAHFVHNAALVTQPKATRTVLKHIHLVSLHETLALLILVVREPTVIRQRTVSLSDATSQDVLTAVSNRLSERLESMTVDDVARVTEFEGLEKQIVSQVAEMMRAEDKPELGRTYMEGLHLVLSQPEFANSPRALALLRLIEREDWVESVLPRDLAADEVSVIIGQENRDEALQDLSIVIGNYSSSGQSRGVIGVVGPRRMDYLRAISSVHYLKSLLGESFGESS